MSRSVDPLIGLTQQALNALADMEQAILQPGGGPLALQQASEAVGFLEQLREAAAASTLEIPEELIQTVDEGRHPESLTYDIWHRTQLANQEVKGRAEAMRHLRDAVQREGLYHFREETIEYFKLIGLEPQAAVEAMEAGTTGEAHLADPSAPAFAHGQTVVALQTQGTGTAAANPQAQQAQGRSNGV